jgi:maltoporin
MKLKTLAVAVTAATISSSAFALDFNGYFRAGFGMNADGGSQVCYGNGGPPSHKVGRLGDECDTYAELSLSQAVVERPTGEKFSIHTLMALGTPNNGDRDSSVNYRGNSWQGVADNNDDPWSGQRFSFREAYAKYIMASGMELWAGNRYYGRKDVHINDWYYVNGSGYGVGVDNINVGLGQLAFAVRETKWLNLATDADGNLADGNQPYTSTPIVDVRWKGVDIGLGSLEFIAMAGKANLSKAQEDAIGDYNDKTGFQGTVEWTLGYAAGFNKLVAQYSTEGFGWSGFGMNNHLGDSLNVSGGGDKDRKSWRIIDHGVYKAGQNFDIGYSAFYSKLDQPMYDWASKDNGTAYGITLRPRYLWNDTMSTQLEVGYYSEDMPWQSEAQDLNKVTLAQAWSPLKEKGGFWARPEIRVFVSSYGGDMTTENNKVTYGAQVEAWW